MKNNNIIAAVAISLVVILIGGAIALVFMLGGGGGVDVDPTAYASKDCTVFLQFDLHMNADELLDHIRPLAKMYQSMMDDSMGDLFEYNASFIDLAGFCVVNSPSLLDEEYVFGIRLSGKGNPQKGIDELFRMINESSSDDIRIEKDEDGFIRIEDEIVMYIDDGYILLSQDVGSIQGAIAVKDGKRESIKQSPDWEAINSNMTSEEFSFLVQLDEDSFSTYGKRKEKPNLLIVGTAYEVPSKSVGLEVTFIGGRDRIRSVFGGDDDFEEFMSVVDTIFDNQKDLSGILSQLPSSSIRMAIPQIPRIGTDFEDPKALFAEGTAGFWFEFDESEYGGVEPGFGMLAKSDTIMPNDLIWELYPKEDYVMKKVFGGKEIHDKYSLSPDAYVFERKPEAYIKDNAEYLIVSSFESILDMIWKPSEIKPMEELAFYMTMDYSKLVKEIIDDSHEPNPILSMPMVSEIVNKASMVFNASVFEDTRDIKLIFELTGDLDMLNELGQSLLP